MNENIIVKVINNNIEDLENIANIKLSNNDKIIFILGYVAGLTQFKNYKEYNSQDVLNLWNGLRKSNVLNDKIKNWINNRV